MKRFLIRTLLYLTPLLALLAWYYLFVDQGAMRGDLGRLAQKEFHFTAPGLDPSVPRGRCRDVKEFWGVGGEGCRLEDDEMMVFGDSFSAENDRLWPDCRWHQFMGGALERNIVMAGDWLNPLGSYLSALTYCPEALGKRVVVECGERSLIFRLCALDFDHVPLPQARKAAGGGSRDWKKEWHRESEKPVEYLKKQLGIDVPVVRAKLNRACFSDRPEELFFYFEDTITYTEAAYSKALKNLRRLDSLSRACGITMVFVAIPDKYTVYKDYVIAPLRKEKRTLEAPCLFETLPCFVNTLPLIKGLVEQGTVDVYMPDDTHFSIPTACAVGRYVAERMDTVAIARE